jgi:probable rRNA maturation factor
MMWEGVSPPRFFLIVIIAERKSRRLSPDALSTFLRRAQMAVGLKGDVNVLLTANQHMRRLNRQFRQKDKPTDVLSFPADLSGKSPEKYAGDLAISVEIARESAKQLGHSLEDEIKVLILHGVLHLAGYDHESDNGEMARTEDRLRQKLDLPIALISRVQSTNGKGKTRPRKSK